MKILNAKELPALFRIKLSAAITITTFAGFVYGSRTLSWSVVTVCAGVFLFAAAASALNQLQELTPDAAMERTRQRPLPLRQLSGYQAAAVAICVGCAGFLLLFFTTARAAALLGLFNLIWYNGVYTPLKRRWGYAFLIGAVCGALPPVIGFIAAGGAGAGGIAVIALFMYFWQIPHFLLILHKHRLAYQTAGMPVPAFLAKDQYARTVIFISFLAAAGTAVLFPLFGVIRGFPPVTVLLIVNITAVIFFYFYLIRLGTRFYFKHVFYGLLVFQACILIVVCAQALTST